MSVCKDYTAFGFVRKAEFDAYLDCANDAVCEVYDRIDEAREACHEEVERLKEVDPEHPYVQEFNDIVLSPTFQENEDGYPEEVQSSWFDDLRVRLQEVNAQHAILQRVGRCNRSQRLPRAQFYTRHRVFRTRAPRSARRAFFSVAASSPGGGDSSGDPDSGDPPGPYPFRSFVTPPSNRKHNQEPSRPWLGLGCCLMERGRSA